MWHHTLLRWHDAHGPRGPRLRGALLLPAGAGGPSKSWPRLLGRLHGHASWPRWSAHLEEHSTLFRNGASCTVSAGTHTLLAPPAVWEDQALLRFARMQCAAPKMLSDKELTVFSYTLQAVRLEQAHLPSKDRRLTWRHGDHVLIRQKGLTIPCYYPSVST